MVEEAPLVIEEVVLVCVPVVLFVPAGPVFLLSPFLIKLVEVHRLDPIP